MARSELIPLDEDVANYWLPGALAWIAVILLIQRRIGVLNLNDRQGNLPYLYHFAAVAVVVVPALLAQAYIHTATGELTRAEAPSAIAATAPTKYYEFNQFCLRRRNALAHPVLSTSGRYNQTLHFDFYVVIPVCAAASVADVPAPLWLGIVYSKSISNALSPSEKDSEYRAFLKQSQAAIDAIDPLRYTYFERAGKSVDHRNFDKALAENPSLSGSGATILIPHSEPFDQRAGKRLPWVFASFGIGVAAWFLMLLFPALDHAKVKAAMDPASAAKGPLSLFVRALFVPSRASYGLPVLIDINILVYVAMVLAGLGVVSFQSEDLIAWGAEYRPAIHGLGILRLFSSQFVHGGLLHIANNLYGLVFAGMFVSPIASNARLSPVTYSRG